MISQLKFVGIPVRDQDRALAFYRDKLGFKIHTDQPMGKQRWIELKIPGAETMLVLFPRPDHVPGESPAISFSADSVRGTYDELRAVGVEFTTPPKKEHWGEHAIFKDSEGNLILFAK